MTKYQDYITFTPEGSPKKAPKSYHGKCKALSQGSINEMNAKLTPCQKLYLIQEVRWHQFLDQPSCKLGFKRKGDKERKREESIEITEESA